MINKVPHLLCDQFTKKKILFLINANCVNIFTLYIYVRYLENAINPSLLIK